MRSQGNETSLRRIPVQAYLLGGCRRILVQTVLWYVAPLVCGPFGLLTHLWVIILITGGGLEEGLSKEGKSGKNKVCIVVIIPYILTTPLRLSDDNYRAAVI